MSNKPNIKIEMLTKLNDSNIDFSTRCNDAYIVFISSLSDLQLINKEELILEWVASNSNKSIKEYSCALDLLVKCFKSHHLTSFMKVVSPEPCLKFIKKSKKYLHDVEIQTQVKDCTKQMMSLNCFQLYFKNDISVLAKIVSMHYGAVSVCGHNENDKCGSNADLLLQLYNETMPKEDFAVKFLDKMMPAIFSIPESLCKCATGTQMYKLMSQIFFKDARTVIEISSVERYIRDPAFLVSARPIIQALVHILTQTVISNEETAMAANFFNIFLSLFIKKTKGCVFKLIISLGSALGFKPKDEDIQLEPKVNCQNGLKILTVMMNQLEINNISLDENESSKIFFKWLISVLKLVMSPTYGISIYVLGIIQSVLNYVPTIFTHVIPQFVEYIMIPQKDDEVRQLYALTLNSVMDIFQKLSRINQLFDIMIKTLLLQAKKNPVLLPPCTVMLPPEFKINFEKLVKEMNTIQSFETIACLISHLDNEMTVPLTTSNTKIDVGQLAVLEFITTLLECLLRNTKVVKTNQSLSCQLHAKIAVTLRKIGQANLKQSLNLKFNKLFFKLCRIWGDSVLLIKSYDDTNKFEDALIYHDIQITEDDSISDSWSDISYTFKFLRPYEWDYFGERARRVSAKGSLDDFFVMVIQNLNLLKLADVLTGDKISLTFENVFSIASPNWLWNNLHNYITYIDENSSLNLVKILVHAEDSESFSHFDKLCKLSVLDGLEGRMLTVLMALEWLRKIAHVLNKLGLDKTQNLLDIIDNESCLVITEIQQEMFCDNDLDDTTMAGVKVIKYGNKVLKRFLLDLNTSKTVDRIDEKDFQQIQSFLDLIYTLKLTGITPVSCKLLLFGAFSVLRELNQQSRKAPQLLFTIISEILVKNIHIGGDVWLNQEFFLWLYTAYEGQSQRKVIFSLACDLIAKKHDVSAEFLEALVSNLELAPLIISAYIKQQQSLKRKKESSKLGQTKQNLSNCLKIAMKALKQLIRKDGVQSQQLHVFTLLLKHNLHTNNEKKIAWCSKYLPGFFSIVCLNVSDPVTSDLTDEFLFVETVFSNWSRLKGQLEQGSHITLWKSFTTKSCLCSSCMELLLKAVNTEEYVSILEAMKEETMKNNSVDKNLVSLGKSWKEVINAKVNAEKIKKRLIYKDFLESEFSLLAAKWATDPPETSSVTAVFCILIAIVNTPTIRIGPENLDIMFVLMSVLPPNDFEALSTGLALLSNLLRKRSSVVMMHLPSFLQRYRFFITCVVEASSREVPETKMCSLYKCTNYIDKTALALSNHKAELAQTVPNVIADMIHLFEVHTLISPVKRSVTNLFNVLLDICSPKNVDYLMQVLTPASREIFKQIYKNYKKFHQYHGKV